LTSEGGGGEIYKTGTESVRVIGVCRYFQQLFR